MSILPKRVRLSDDIVDAADDIDRTACRRNADTDNLAKITSTRILVSKISFRHSHKNGVSRSSHEN